MSYYINLGLLFLKNHNKNRIFFSMEEPYSSLLRDCIFSGGNSVQDVGGEALRISDKFVLIFHIF